MVARLMYRYDEFDRSLVAKRVEQFREQVDRRMSGDLTEDEFRPLRLMNGVYLQLHAYMLRVAIPYGVLSSNQMRMLAHIARKYDRGYGHFTTRQNIQYNWPKLIDIPDILEELSSVDMHAIQTSGNCIRNVTADPYAGAIKDEVDDPRIWSEIIRQWSTLHPEFSFLPRKFKIALTGSEQDRAAIKFHDIGLKIIYNKNTELGFEVMVGGGQGRTPMIAKTIREFLPANYLLSYLEAILRIYNLMGRRDNKYKARIKILVHELGIEEFKALVEKEWLSIKSTSVELPPGELIRIKNYFKNTSYKALPATSVLFEGARKSDKQFARWVTNNVLDHTLPGYCIVNISLKKIGDIPGDASADQMDLIAELAQEYSSDEVRVTYQQNLVLPHVPLDDLFTVWSRLSSSELATPNIGQVSDMIACPGLDYCSLANARSIPIAQQIAKLFDDPQRHEEIGPIEIKISGCINACGHHHAGHIGILGVDKKGEEFYQILLGGSASEDAQIGKILGPSMDKESIPLALERIIGKYIELRIDGESFIDVFRRLGAKPFKDAVYEVD
tara:strand:+ start:767 stop:2437 length:1671 start_codon:yes stop_codon:yes gene_type:complete